MEKSIVVRGYAGGSELLDKYLKKGWTVKFPPVTFNDGEDVFLIIESPKEEK